MAESKYTRKHLLQVPKRKWDEPIKTTSVYVIPSGRKHDSGFACMDFVADTTNGLVGFGGSCDDVAFEGKNFRMDCIYPERIIHIWNPKAFVISTGISSIVFSENGGTNDG